MPLVLQGRVYEPDEIHTSRVGIILIVLGAILVVGCSMAGLQPWLTITVTGGVSVFAVGYLDAQLIERLVEPFSEVEGGRHLNRERSCLFGATDRIRDLRKSGDFRTTDQDKELSKLEAKRVFGLWGVTSFMGMILCYFTAGLFQQAGAIFNPTIYSTSWGIITGHAVDSILSGIIVGAGTKPLHDFITTVQKASKS